MRCAPRRPWARRAKTTFASRKKSPGCADSRLAGNAARRRRSPPMSRSSSACSSPATRTPGGATGFPVPLLSNTRPCYPAEAGLEVELWDHPRPARQRLTLAERLAILGRLPKEPHDDQAPRGPRKDPCDELPMRLGRVTEPGRLAALLFDCSRPTCPRPRASADPIQAVAGDVAALQALGHKALQKGDFQRERAAGSYPGGSPVFESA